MELLFFIISAVILFILSVNVFYLMRFSMSGYFEPIEIIWPVLKDNKLLFLFLFLKQNFYFF